MLPGDESPWQILGLDAATATVRDVKRAYAALLKQNRPDENPEGFRRVHDAYQAALYELEAGEPGHGVVPAPPVPDADQPSEDGAIVLTPAVQLPADFSTAAKKLRAANDFKSTALALGELRAACGDDASLWREWGLLLCGVFDAKPSSLTIVATVISNAEILAELRAGFAAASLRILTAWHREQFFENMVEVGRVLTAMESESQFQHPACGLFALRLAWELAIAQPGGASLLLDAAFRWMPAPLRPEIVPPVEERLRIGRIFWHVPGKWYHFWACVLDDLNEVNELDWTKPEWRPALNELLRVTPFDWPGWGFFQPYFRKGQWEQIIRSYQSREPGMPWVEPPEREWIDSSVSRVSLIIRAQASRESGKADAPAPVALAGEIKDVLASPLTTRMIEDPYSLPAASSGERFRRLLSGALGLLFMFWIARLAWWVWESLFGD